MPKLDGRATLQKIKQDSGLRCRPISILSTSVSQEDIDFAYANGANCFVSKNADFEVFSAALDSLFHFWRDIARRPSTCN